ncbi:MAG: hypothetical protein GXP08_00645 [Gammaproteobacteria bacterium]|nr:hypothetical protein [Gammaproteobacteria bacterium]
MPHLFKFMRYLFYVNLVFLFACSSSGGEGGTGNNDISVGTITEFGSIYVNGIKFDTTSSIIDLDGTAGTNSDLRLGMVVTVKGDIEQNGLTGTANKILVKEVLKGPASNNNGLNTFDVLGQTIQVTGATKFNNFPNSKITDINEGDIVEISGYVRGDGIISATRIELLDTTETEFKVTGTIKNLSRQNMTFELGNLQVNYSELVNNDNELPTGFDNGLFVEVQGRYNATSLVADEIEREELDADNADEMELEGYVTSMTSANNFRVNNVAVQTDANTEFDGGTLADIAMGIFIEIKGPLVKGILLANEIEFEDIVKIEAVVESLNPASGSLTLLGLGDITVVTNALTDYDDGINAFSDISENNTLKIHGNPDRTNTATVLATKISLENETPESEVSVQGTVTAISDPNISILGLEIDTSSFSDDDFELENDINGRSNFFATVNTGDIIEFEGDLNLNSATIIWSEVSFEN